MVYNLTDIAANGTSLVGLIQAVNTDLTFGWFGTLLLMGLVAVAFMSFMWGTQDSAKSISASAMIAFGLAVLLRAMSLISDLTLFITLIASAASIAFLWKK